MASGFRSKFFQNYAAKVMPKMEDMEKYRQRKYKQLIICETVFIIVILYFLSVVLTNFFPHTFGSQPFTKRADWEIWLAFFAPIIIVALIAIAFAIPKTMDKNFKNNVKMNCIDDMLRVFGNMQWHHKCSPSCTDMDILTSGLFIFSKCEFDDCFTGTYNNVKYSVAETHLMKKVHTKHGSRYVTVFKGIILSCPFNKTVKAHTIIYPKSEAVDEAFANIIGILMVIAFIALFIFFPEYWKVFWSQNIIDIIAQVSIFIGTIAALFTAKNFKKVKLEDVVFDKDYAVKSEDQVEARYLVTPSFMERFKNLKKAYNSKDIRCAFFNDQIMFAISTNKDLFEFGTLYRPLTDSRQISGFYSEIRAIFDIIDEFKLDEKTGL